MILLYYELLNTVICEWIIGMGIVNWIKQFIENIGLIFVKEPGYFYFSHMNSGSSVNPLSQFFHTELSYIFKGLKYSA